MSRSLAMTLAGAGLLLVSQLCFAAPVSPVEAYLSSQVVFQGKVLSQRSITVNGAKWQEAVLSMEKAWKGVSGETVTVRSLAGHSPCKVDFWVGTSYVVYAASDTNGVLTASTCTRTRPLADAAEDIAYLDGRNPKTVKAGTVFPDVPTDHPDFEAVTALYGAGIMTGYPDGTFRPDRHVTRAEIVRVLIDAAPGYRIADDVTFQDPYDAGWLHFHDVESGEWYVPFLRKAVQGGVVKGYRDGTFKPANPVTVAEASKMIAVAFGLSRDWDGPRWYEQYLQALSVRRAIPPSITSVDAPLTRGQLAEIVWRIRESRTDRPSVMAESIEPVTCDAVDDPELANVDMRKVRDAWFSWYNAERTKAGLKPYTEETQLDRTAYEWSSLAADAGVISHVRPGQSGAGYDYAAVRRWFQDHGLTFANTHGSTFTENIGWYPYSCDKTNCTDALIAAARHTFDMYQAERDTDGPHWNGIVNPDFRIMGLGIAARGGKEYLTVHIGTEIVSQPPPVCR